MASRLCGKATGKLLTSFRFLGTGGKCGSESKRNPGTPAHLGTGGKLFYTGSDFRKNQNVIPYTVWDICAPALRISSPAYQLNRVSAVLGIISAIWRISSISAYARISTSTAMY